MSSRSLDALRSAAEPAAILEALAGGLWDGEGEPEIPGPPALGEWLASGDAAAALEEARPLVEDLVEGHEVGYSSQAPPAPKPANPRP